MSELTNTMQEIARMFVDSGELFEAMDIRTMLHENHSDLVRSQYDELGDRQLLREIKTYLRTMAQDDDTNGQMTLPGLKLPTTIAIPAENESGFVYRSTLSATLDDLEAARHVRIKNVERAQIRLDQMDASIEMLRPQMEYDRSITVGEAIERMSTGRAA